MHTPLSFGQRIKQRRKELDLTQDELARRVSCSLETVKKIELEKRRPSRQMAEAMVSALKITAPNDKEEFLALARGRAPDHDLPLSDGHIPLPPNPMVNRTSESEAVCTLLLREDIRLVTLTGPGGVGKTRLAIHAAQALQGSFADGVRLVHLESISQPGLFMTAVAHGLGFSVSDEQSACRRLIDHFQEKRLLLVLDNFEQILEAAPGVAAWLEAAAGLKVLVTSRARLRLSAEYEYPVPPMGLPDLKALPSAVELGSRYPAVELFVSRLQAIRPAFRINDRNAAAVAEICVLLDGLPLALELAAARGKLLAPSALLEQLLRFRPMGLLTVGARDLPARQQTIRRTMDWSYSLLGEPERVLFERLGVFMGGASLEAIEAVCGQEGAQEHLEGLQTLIDHSLIWRDERSDGAQRFQMLATLREYALERLEQRGELDLSRQRHASYFERLVPRLVADLRGPLQAATVQILDTEQGNLRVALEWCCTPGSGAGTGMEIAGRLWEFWILHGDIEEGRTWIERLLALPEAQAPTLLRARLLNGLGLLWSPSRRDASPALSESVSIFHSLGETLEEAWALTHLAQGHLWRGEFELARPCCEESLRLLRPLGADWHTGWALYNLAQLSIVTGDLARGEELLSQGLALFQPLDDRRALSWFHDAYGDLARRRQDVPAAIQAYTQALECVREMGDPLAVARFTLSLGDAFLADGKIDQAAACLRESLPLYRNYGESWGIGYALTGFAGLALRRGSAEQAASILGAASFFLEKADTFTRNYLKTSFTQVEQELHQCLGEENYTRLWQAGRETPADILKKVMAWGENPVE